MKKRLIGTLLMGALMVSSTSVFVSCKDYDDDINNIVATKADKTALEEAKQTLESEIQGLRDQLSTAQGQIDALTNNKADKFKVGEETYNLETVWNQLYPLLQRVSNCESDIDAHQKAIDNINSMIGGKLEGDLAGKTYKEALTETYATAAAASTQAAKNLEAITDLQKIVNDPETGLVAGLKAVKNDLQSQVEALEKLATRVQTIEGDYLKAADKKALQDEIDKKIEKLNGDLTNAIKDAKQAAIDAAATDATKKADKALGDAKTYTNDQIAALNIDSLKAAVKNLSDSVDKYVPLVNNLNVYVRQSLRGLVFNMKSFYQGVEATDLTVLYYNKYALKAADADLDEEYGYISSTDWTARNLANSKRKVHNHVVADKSTRYSFTRANRVLQFEAYYYMNPSSAAIAKDDKVSIVAFDKPFHSSVEAADGENNVGDTIVYASEFNGANTTYDAGLSVKSWETKNGMLVVNYDCTKPEAIRSIVNNKAITVFATQVEVAKDTTITSDFAALYKQKVDSIVISHTLSSSKALLHHGQYIGSHAANKVNSHCGQCALNNNEYAAGLHLMQTVSEAAGMSTGKFKPSTAGGFDAQDSVGYRDTLNLNKLVEIHWDVIDANNNATHVKASAEDIAKAGLHFEFELTGLFYGSNETSESAHAAIKLMADPTTNDTTKYYFLRPQMPDSVDNGAGHKLGKAAAWNNGDVVKGKVGKQDRQTIGRTPVVRVKLLDEAGNILDYGYIRIKIVDDPETPEAYQPEVISYNAPKMTASQNFCADLAGTPWTWRQTWAEMEYDIHHRLGITQAEFEANYVMDGADNIFTQYYLANGQFKACTESETNHSHANDTLGVIRYIPNILDEQTSVIEWNVSNDTIVNYVNRLGTATANLTRYIRFNLKQNAAAGSLPYFYVAIIPAGLEVTTAAAVTGSVNWNNGFNRKNQNYWYAENANPATKDVGAVVPKGYVEIHTNVLAVEDRRADNWVSPFEAFDTKLSDVFSSTGATGSQANKVVSLNNDAFNAFVTTTSETVKGKDLHYTLVFVDSTYAKRPGYAHKNYVGNNGVTYTLKVGDIKDNPFGKEKALLAYKSDLTWETATPGETRDTIAKLVLDGGAIASSYSRNDSINHMVVEYQNNYVADALVNFKAHDELGYDVIKAVVGLKANYLTCSVPLYNNTIDVRFLRPINVYSNDYEIEDASTNSGTQTINLRDLVRLTDWREQAFKTETGDEDYWKYYNIKAIKVLDVASGANISTNSAVKTDMDLADADKNDLSKAVALSTKTGALDFKYSPNIKTVGEYGEAASYGTLVYSNLSNTVQEFNVWLPIEVVYQWGSVYTTVKIHIKQTRHNARAAK